MPERDIFMNVARIRSGEPALEAGRGAIATAPTGRVVAVNLSRGGVPKLPVESAAVGHLGLSGDGHNEPEPMHGGPDQAVCLYSVEAIERVAADGHRSFPGAFGENLTLAGIDFGGLRTGHRLRIGGGGPVLELTKYAAPCKTIGHYFVDGRFGRISPTAHPEDARWYARVLAEGVVRPGDTVEVIEPEGAPEGADATAEPG